MKQIATEERQAEKGKMKEWKENIMQEVARELHIIRQMHEGAMEAQRQSLQLELERMGGKVEQLESEVKALKVPGHQLARKTPLAKSVAPSGSDGQEERDRGQTEQSRIKTEARNTGRSIRIQQSQAYRTNQNKAPNQLQKATLR